MKQLMVFMVGVATIGVTAGIMLPVSGQANEQSVAPYITEMPDGYRDWKWIASAHEEGSVNSLGAVLGNDVAVEAYREGELPFPDGTIIAALHCHYVASDENNKVFGQAQSFVPGAPTNVQFMVKDSKKYAATGGWGFGHFQNGKPAASAAMKSCFPCHEKATGSDLVFTRYAP